MKCLVFVKFLPGGSIAPDEFFSHLNAEWGWYDEQRDQVIGNGMFESDFYSYRGPASAVCVADYDSIQQLAIDLSIMPGAGIGGIEVIPVPDHFAENEFMDRTILTSFSGSNN